ncbi:MAG: hypothetical protein FWG03_02875 [Clostridiales bacterium]|nr:hypothetical protein [Clostridiales bacterium]
MPLFQSDGGDGQESGPKLADAPEYGFGGGQFTVFDGKQRVDELSSLMFLEFYSHYIKDINENTYDIHDMREAIENASGGELFGLLSSPIINANDFDVARRAVLIDRKQYPWTVLWIRLIYPDTVLGGGYQENAMSYEEDIVTIFANCDAYFIKDGYQAVVVTGNWDDTMKTLTGYILEEGETSFLGNFD